MAPANLSSLITVYNEQHTTASFGLMMDLPEFTHGNESSFVGREGIMKQLKQKLGTTDQRGDSHQQGKAALYGLGGVGYENPDCDQVCILATEGIPGYSSALDLCN